MIDWLAFVQVFFASILATAVVVSAYALGLRLLSLAGKVPVVEPAAFTDAITVITPAEAKAIAKRARKAAKKSPLTELQKKWATAGAYVSFGAAGAAVLYGIYLIVPYFHH